MDAMRFFGFILAVVVGGVMMALILEFLNPDRLDVQTEGKRRVDVEPAVQSVATLPAFFATLQANEGPPAVAGFDDALLAFLQNHVKAEQAMVTKFVLFPSVDNLYRQARPSPRVH